MNIRKPAQSRIIRTKKKEDMVMIERHIQTILIVLITGSIMFAGNYFFTDKSDKAVLTQQLTQLNTQIQEIRSDIRNIQTQYISKDLYNDHESRIRALERHFDNAHILPDITIRK